MADAFICMRFPFDSEEAQKLNQQIFETIYYGALEASCELAEEQGPYETYEGCPVSTGVCLLLLFDKSEWKTFYI
jgi:ribonucleoside-diphosphate reductase subunit M1